MQSIKYSNTIYGNKETLCVHMLIYKHQSLTYVYKWNQNIRFLMKQTLKIPSDVDTNYCSCCDLKQHLQENRINKKEKRYWARSGSGCYLGQTRDSNMGWGATEYLLTWPADLRNKRKKDGVAMAGMCVLLARAAACVCVLVEVRAVKNACAGCGREQRFDGRGAGRVRARSSRPFSYDPTGQHGASS